MKVYCGYSNDLKKLSASASGGLATALAERMIELGGVVFGVRYTNDYRRAIYSKIETLADVNQIRGSKYISASKNGLFEQIEKELNDGRCVLVSGLGCDIAAIKSYCQSKQLNTNKLYCIDILCHGPAPQRVHELFIEELEKKYKGKIVDYSVRYKKNGWFPFYVRANFDNGKKFVRSFEETDFGLAFYNVAKPACTKCPFKGEGHQGDICVGDYWGVNRNSPVWNEKGVSVVVVQTERGEELIKLLDDRFHLEEADEDLFLKNNPMYLESRKQKTDYDAFMNCMEEKGLHYSARKMLGGRHYRFKNFIHSIKVIVKKIVRWDTHK